MKAGETPLFKMLEGTKQFVIPLFQRTYSWQKEDWETLWNDIVETYEMSDGHQHFLGSIVNKSLTSTPDNVSPYVVIDGQQRLTTLTLLLAALRDVVRVVEPQLANKLHGQYLTNAYVSGTDIYKVLPTQADRPEYFAVIDGHPTLNQASRVRQAYEYFHSTCSHTPKTDDDQGIDLKRLAGVITNGIELVNITLDEPDNEYRIFESLNAKGAPLTQADLLRNYFFMNIPPANGQQDAVYSNVWLPMQQRLDGALEDFFRYQYLRDGVFVRQGDVYQEWKRRLDKLNLVDYTDQLRHFDHASQYYKRLIDPGTEPNPQIARRLTRLNRWGGQTMYPFLLYVYERCDKCEVDAAGMVEILRMIESFLVRRLFARVPTNALNRLFLRLSQQLPPGLDVVEGTHAALSDPGRRWPSDDEFRQAIQSYPLYLDSRADQRKLVLEELDASFENKEALMGYDKLTIEHIMPQTLTDQWRAELGPDADDVHRRHLHVLGNLTLTGYNPDLSNKPFTDKKELLSKSNVEMNKLVAKEPQWTKEQIVARGQQLAERALQSWPGPAI